MANHSSTFIWYELMTSDAEAATAFYGAVLGWTVSPAGSPGMDYRLLSTATGNVAGLLAIPPDGAANGMRPGWFGYISVADVDASVKRIVAAGGQSCMPATDIPNVGRIAMVLDPQGAAIYVMTPIGEGPSPSFQPGTPGHGAWNELHASDWESALAFYRSEFGFDLVEAMDMGPAGKYALYNFGSGEPVGGMCNNAQAPKPFWLYYFGVDEIDAAVGRVGANGGEVVMGPHQVPGGAWIVHGRDPQGALFALVGPRLSA